MFETMKRWNRQFDSRARKENEKDAELWSKALQVETQCKAHISIIGAIGSAYAFTTTGIVLLIYGLLTAFLTVLPPSALIFLGIAFMAGGLLPWFFIATHMRQKHGLHI